MKVLTLFIICLLPSASTLAGNLLVVVNDKNETKSISAEDLRDIYLQKKTHWDSGKRIFAIDFKDSPTLREDFCRVVLNMTCAKYDSLLLKALYRDPSKRVKRLEKQSSALVTVSLQKEAIAYVEATKLPKNVRVILRLDY